MLRVEANTHTPIYRQIVEQIERLAASGRLTAGERLPSVRRLAEQLLVNPNTVARAIRELEHAGVVVTRHGDGVFVADRASPFRAAERKRMLRDAVDRVLEEAEALRLGVDDVVEVVQDRARTRHAERAG